MKQCPARTTCITIHRKFILTMVAMARVTTMKMTMGPGVRDQAGLVKITGAAETARMVTGMEIVAIA